MADTTPTYGFPFLELGDPPDLAAGTEDLATAVEAKIITVDAAIAAITGLTPVVASSSTGDFTTGTSYTAGTPEVGVAFVAPPSGIVFVTMHGRITQNQATEEAIMSFTVRTGSTVGVGTVVGGSANVNRAIVAGQVVVSGSLSVAAGSVRDMFTGLTPGASYNARIEFTTTAGGNCGVLYRRLLVEPSP